MPLTSLSLAHPAAVAPLARSRQDYRASSSWNTRIAATRRHSWDLNSLDFNADSLKPNLSTNPNSSSSLCRYSSMSRAKSNRSSIHTSSHLNSRGLKHCSIVD
ncbi:hypothetical protein PINS_up011287 [Pythium insidiosum]|nr:hypothetical protein PINS_up011287 [Pythium insidiosum]